MAWQIQLDRFFLFRFPETRRSMLVMTHGEMLCTTQMAPSTLTEGTTIPKPPRIPSDMIELQMYYAGTTQYSQGRITHQAARTVRCGA